MTEKEEKEIENLSLKVKHILKAKLGNIKD
jgi:hypothetical protein